MSFCSDSSDVFAWIFPSFLWGECVCGQCVCTFPLNQLEGIWVSDVSGGRTEFPRCPGSSPNSVAGCLLLPVTECRHCHRVWGSVSAASAQGLSACSPSSSSGRTHYTPLHGYILTVVFSPWEGKSPETLSIFAKFWCYSLLFHIKFRKMLFLNPKRNLLKFGLKLSWL